MAASTPDLRRDPVTGLWTVVTPGRTRRPADDDRRAVAPCPFCAGNEGLTPPEVDAQRPLGGGADGPGWTLRVVPNKFPIFAGGHEVVIHSPDHDAPLHVLSDDEVTATLDACRRRLCVHAAAGAAAGLVAVNQGASAGASLAHPHAQIFALPIVPPALVAEVDNLARYHAKRGRCLLCDIVARTRDEQTHLLFDGEIVAWTPDASRYPYEVRLAPAHHADDFRVADPPTLEALAAALKRILSAIDRVTEGAALNWWLHTAPFDSAGPFHWHVEVAPRTTMLAAFEFGAGVAVDVVDPVEAAARLRGALAGERLPEPRGG